MNSKIIFCVILLIITILLAKVAFSMLAMGVTGKFTGNIASGLVTACVFGVDSKFSKIKMIMQGQEVL